MEFLDRVVEYIENPTLVQIGAMDGQRYETINKYIKKWKINSLLVEPIPEMFKKLKENYAGHEKYVRFEQSAVTEKNGVVSMYRVDHQELYKKTGIEWGDGLSSLYKDRNFLGGCVGYRKQGDDLERAKLVKKLTTSVEVNGITLDDLFLKHKIEKIDILQTDTEGHDWEIIQLFDFTKYRPYFIKVEIINLNGIEINSLKALLTTHGYVCQTKHVDLIATRGLKMEGSADFLELRKKQRRESINYQRKLTPDSTLAEKFVLRQKLAPISLSRTYLKIGPPQRFLVICEAPLDLPNHQTIIYKKTGEAALDAIFLAVSISPILQKEVEYLAWIEGAPPSADRLEDIFHSAPEYLYQIDEGPGNTKIITGHRNSWLKWIAGKIQPAVITGSLNNLSDKNRASTCDRCLEEIRIGKSTLVQDDLVPLLFQAYLGFWYAPGLRERAIQIAKIIHTLNKHYMITVVDNMWGQLAHTGVTNGKGDWLRECEKFYDFHSILSLLL